jgi:hypothetical protein
MPGTLSAEKRSTSLLCTLCLSLFRAPTDAREPRRSFLKALVLSDEFVLNSPPPDSRFAT